MEPMQWLLLQSEVLIIEVLEELGLLVQTLNVEDLLVKETQELPVVPTEEMEVQEVLG